MTKNEMSSAERMFIYGFIMGGKPKASAEQFKKTLREFGIAKPTTAEASIALKALMRISELGKQRPD